MFFAQNIKLLRQLRKISQDELANALNMKRSSYSNYENGAAEPSLEVLVRISDYFGIEPGKLIKTDLSTLDQEVINVLVKGTNVDITGQHLRVLATTVDSNNEENIELVPIKAKAGYTAGFADPGYIKVLQTFNLPFLDRNKKYRTFQISGDSMPPVSEGSWVTGEFIQNWNYIKDKYPHIIVTRDEGIVFKVVFNKIAERQTLLLCSTNPLYEPYEIHVSEVLEVWKFVNFISSELPEPNIGKEDIAKSLYNLQKEVKEIRNVLKTEKK